MIAEVEEIKVEEVVANPNNDEMIQQLEKLVEELNIQNGISSENVVADYSNQLENIINNQVLLLEKLESYNEFFDLVSSASSVIVTYGVYYVPLIIITGMFWWFIRQFIR